MKLRTTVAARLGVFALVLTPAALAGQPADPGGQGNGPNYSPEKPETPGPKAPLPEKANAYGVYCKTESREHVKGEKGTAFSRCVTAMARAATDEDLTPRQACKDESRKHVKGEKGTPFSRCVTAAAKLREEEAADQQD